MITTDILLTGIRRDDVFEWLGDPAHHREILEGAFDDVQDLGEGRFDLGLNAAGKRRVMGYRYQGKDDSHGGRRVLVDTEGKRTKGKMHYSLRTMKPSKNTLVTLHLDYSAGGPLGGMISAAGLSAALEASMVKMLDNLDRAIQQGS